MLEGAESCPDASGQAGSRVPSAPLHSPIGAPPEPHRSLPVVPSIRIEGTTGRLRDGPREGRVQGGRNREPEARRFGVPSWVRMGRRDAAGG